MAAPLESLLDEALESWAFTREGVIAEAETVPSSGWEWRPAAGSRSVSELVRHIVEAGQMGAGELTRPDGDFHRVPVADMIEEYSQGIDAVSGRDALIELLRSTHVDGDRRFRDAGELRMLQTIRRFDGRRGSRLAWLYHLVDHESYHRGQLALYVRQLGHVPALTKAIHGG